MRAFPDLSFDDRMRSKRVKRAAHNVRALRLVRLRKIEARETAGRIREAIKERQ